jgi:hypothetical protein
VQIGQLDITASGEALAAEALDVDDLGVLAWLERGLVELGRGYRRRAVEL